jgi:hypothetical protein
MNTMQESKKMKELLSDLMASLCTHRPADPIQYIIDTGIDSTK